MPRRFVTVGALTGSTLIALSLVGSPRNLANVPFRPDPAALAESSKFHVQGKAVFAAGRSEDARASFGTAAVPASAESAISQSPALIHFAKPVVSWPDQFGSGLIAPWLGTHGAVSLMGPDEFAADRVPAVLIVMGGCHSAQGAALAESGLMGLTRAWIGAGARAVISTQWDIPDDVAQAWMANFCGAPAQNVRKSGWAGYFLLSGI